MNLLTLKAAATRLAVSVTDIRRRIKTGEIAAVKLGHRTLRVSEDELARFVAAHLIPPPASSQ